MVAVVIAAEEGQVVDVEVVVFVAEVGLARGLRRAVRTAGGWVGTGWSCCSSRRDRRSGWCGVR